tara:strand:+ start:217 stop:642 length:426 start_codon:yes stop_codon:yes gene_type:complete
VNKTDYLIPEILENASKFENRDQRISYLREYISHPLREVLKLVFDDRYVFSFDDMPPFKKSDVPTGLGMNTLFNEAKRLYIFTDPEVNKMGPMRTEQNLIGLLESVDPMEADLIVKILTNKFDYNGIDKQLVQDAFPGLIP